MVTIPSGPGETQPEPLTFLAHLGQLAGSNSRYEKRLADLEGIYQDTDEFKAQKDNVDDPVYWVESSTLGQGAGALTIGISVLRPGTIGGEFFMTRGHLHVQAECAELYYGLQGTGVILLETIDGESRCIELTPGKAVHIPGHWIHRSVNVGDTDFATLFCYPTDAGQDYEIIADAGGMQNLVVTQGDGAWATEANPSHTGYRSRC